MKYFYGTLLGLLCGTAAWPQENIPIGTWRPHLSFNNLNALAVAPGHVYAANGVGVLDFDKAGQEVVVVSKVDGLSSAEISTIAYDSQRKMLLVAFENGLINIIEGNTVSVFDNLAISPAIPGSRKVNHIGVHNDLAYLSTDFGVVVFDLEKREVKETYRDLSDTGENLGVNSSAVSGDSLYLATAQGVLAGAMDGTSNLLDFRSWKRYVQGAMNSNIASITNFNGMVYAAINQQGVFLLQNGSWAQQPYLQTATFRKMSSPFNALFITTADKVWSVDGAGLKEVGAGSITNPDEAITDSEGVVWVADGNKGLLFIKDGTVNQVKPNGPSSNAQWRVTYSQGRVLASHGGYTPLLQPLGNISKADQFVNGQWGEINSGLKSDITDQEISAGATYVSSFGFGLEKTTASGSMVFDDSNSPLQKAPPLGLVLVPSIAASSDGIWVANYGVFPSLHWLSHSNDWQSFPINRPQAQFPVDLLVDKVGHVWMVVDPLKGGGIVVYDKNENKNVYLSDVPGKGGLPSAVVKSMANDRDGQVWVGTDKGVAYFPSPQSVFDPVVDAVRPIFENRYLLRDETVTAIAVDGGNRKWLGTNNGIWLFGPSGEEVVYNFTTNNSPLLSNTITSVAIDPNSGEVFIGTDKGMASFRSAATASTNRFGEVKIFPNPVSADFTGPVAINGLYTDAIVKITDISGKLVWQAQAHGGTATWDARQVNGRRVSPGIYLVFATAEDGTERHVGKIAVIE